jgi:hypothetical protein
MLILFEAAKNVHPRYSKAANHKSTNAGNLNIRKEPTKTIVIDVAMAHRARH